MNSTLKNYRYHILNCFYDDLRLTKIVGQTLDNILMFASENKIKDNSTQKQMSMQSIHQLNN